MEPATAVVILLGAGSGRRLDAREPKALTPIGGRPMLTMAAEAAVTSAAVGGLVVAFPQEWEAEARACLEGVGATQAFVTGGDSRQASVRAALAEIDDDTDVVVVHDAARPFASPHLFTAVIDEITRGSDAAIPVVEIADTVLRVRGDEVLGSEPREEFVLAQTPQGFRASVLREAHAKAAVAGLSFTDDASLLAWAGFEIRTIAGDLDNVKITTPADLARADRRMRKDD